MRASIPTTTCYIDPDTGTLDLAPRHGCEEIPIVPGVTGPVILQCSLHGVYHHVATVEGLVSSRMTQAVENFVRAALAAACPTCSEWRKRWHAFSTTLRRIRTDPAHCDYLAAPVRTLLAAGRAINAPLPLPETLAAFAGMALPADPSALPLGGTYGIDRVTGAALAAVPGRLLPAGSVPLPVHTQWCLLHCRTHGWESVASLNTMALDTLTASRKGVYWFGIEEQMLLHLGTVLASQGCGTCDELRVKVQVLDQEATAIADLHKSGTGHVSPLAAMRAHQQIAGAIHRTLTDLGYVVAKALEALADL